MAARPRNTFLVKSDLEQENARVAAAKGLLKPLTKRPALNDIDSNRVRVGAIGGPLKPVLKPTGIPSTKPSFVTTRRPVLKAIGPKECKKPQATAAAKPEKKVQPKEEETATAKPDDECVCVDETEPVGYSTAVYADPDADVLGDPQLVAEYCEDIFHYLRELEVQYPIRKDFLLNHQSTPGMRFILVNWLVQVHQNFKLSLESLYMAVNLTDRYLQVSPKVGRQTLQLVGTTALWVAAKYEEVYIQGLDDTVYICDDTFSKNQVLKMEKDILMKTEFCLGRPVAITFLRRYSKLGRVDQYQHAMAKYLLELMLVDYGFSHVRPSIQAAAASCLATSILSDEPSPAKSWTPTLAHFTTHEFSVIEPYIVQLAHLVVKSHTFKNNAVKDKYATVSHFLTSVHPKLSGSLIKKLTANKA